MTHLASFVCRTILTAAASLSTCAAHADYPNRPITLVVVHPPGGTLDSMARLLAPRLAQQLGQLVVLDFRGGGMGIVGTTAVVESEPDGYTLMLDASNHARNPAIYRKIPYDTLTALTPISLISRAPHVLVVNPHASIKNVADLIKQGHEEHGPPLYFASAGVGSPQHLAGELFNVLAGTHLEHFAYWGNGPALIDLASGRVPVMFASIGTVAKLVRNGTLRALAVGGSTRSPHFPELPTIAEAGVPGYESYEWHAIFAPGGTPMAIVEHVSLAVAQALKDPALAESLNAIGVEIIGSTPRELETYRRAEIAKWRRVIQEVDLLRY